MPNQIRVLLRRDPEGLVEVHQAFALNEAARELVFHVANLLAQSPKAKRLQELDGIERPLELLGRFGVGVEFSQIKVNDIPLFDFEGKSVPSAGSLLADKSQSGGHADRPISISDLPRGSYLLYLFLPTRDRQIIEREMEEVFLEILTKFGPRKASLWYWSRLVGNIIACWYKPILKIASVSGITTALTKAGIVKTLLHKIGLL